MLDYTDKKYSMRMSFIYGAMKTISLLFDQPTYTSHTGQCMPKDAVFECTAVCLSVIIELLRGLIPFTSKWHAG